MLYPVGGGERKDAFAGVSAAHEGGILTTPDNPEQIYNWYQTRLLAAGWTFEGDIARVSTESSAQGYVRGKRETITLGIDNPKLLRDTLGHPVPASSTIYEYRYFINPAR
ncbi:MAG: hypothetical protein ABR573_00200 [Candidatus Dormibacteria bacterium]